MGIIKPTKSNKPIDSPGGSVSIEISFNNLDDEGPSTSSASHESGMSLHCISDCIYGGNVGKSDMLRCCTCMRWMHQYATVMKTQIPLVSITTSVVEKYLTGWMILNESCLWHLKQTKLN